MKHKWKKDHNGEIDMWAWELGFHNGPVCEVCGRTVCENCAPDWMNLDDCPGPHIITNADHIRAMSDEELAASPIICRTICNLIYDRGENKKYCLKDEPCSSCIRNWLKAPYKENEDGDK